MISSLLHANWYYFVQSLGRKSCLVPFAAGEAAEPLAENDEALVEEASKATEEWLEPVKHYFSEVKEDWQIDLPVFI